ncbi:MAG: hypothetical protein COB24_12150 [Hyphomicrobiales bacterium]|nr:MAG: hypothetical protein COB24_12150 [Hyphomicrobiales bacterium]
MRKYKLNKFDKKIIEQLKINGRLSFAELARRVGLSCWAWVKNLEDTRGDFRLPMQLLVAVLRH